MKKVKFYKKRNRRRKIFKNREIFLNKACINLTIFISILILLLILIIFLVYKFIENKITIGPNEIMYKGSKILKTKLISDYFSRISIEQQNKDDERKVLNELLNLSEYSNLILKINIETNF